MGFFDFLGFTPDLPELTEPIVKAIEEKAKLSDDQLKLMRRWVKANATIRVNEAESQHIFKLGTAIADEQIKTINQCGKAAIKEARTLARSSSQKALTSYAQSLIKRGKNDE